MNHHHSDDSCLSPQPSPPQLVGIDSELSLMSRMTARDDEYDERDNERGFENKMVNVISMGDGFYNKDFLNTSDKKQSDSPSGSPGGRKISNRIKNIVGSGLFSPNNKKKKLRPPSGRTPGGTNGWDMILSAVEEEQQRPKITEHPRPRRRRRWSLSLTDAQDDEVEKSADVLKSRRAHSTAECCEVALEVYKDGGDLGVIETDKNNDSIPSNQKASVEKRSKTLDSSWGNMDSSLREHVNEESGRDECDGEIQAVVKKASINKNIVFARNNP